MNEYEKNLEEKQTEKQRNIIYMWLKSKCQSIKWEPIKQECPERFEFTAEYEDVLIVDDPNVELSQIMSKLQTKLKTYHPNFYAAHVNELCKGKD